MSRLTDGDPPREGTNAAIAYWAARTREALRAAQAMLSEGDTESAATWAEEASGCGGEFAEAVHARASAHVA